MVNAHDLRELTELAAKLTGAAGSIARAFVDRATVQVETPGLRVGVATEGGRPIGEVLATIDGLGLYRDVWSFQTSERPGGVDVWVLILTADQSGLEQERAFIESLGSDLAKQCVVMVTRMERVPPEHVQEIRSKTEELFLPLGVPADQLLHGAADLGQLRKLLERWWARREEVRRRSLQAFGRPLLVALRDEEAQLNQRIQSLPSHEQLVSQQRTFDRDSSGLLQSLIRAGEAELSGLPERLATAWPRLEQQLDHEDKLDQQRFESILESWLQANFADPFERKIRALLERETDALKLSSLFAAADLGTGAVNRPDVALPKRARRGGFVRTIFPLMGGALGFVRGGPRTALMGGAAGAVVARMLTKNRKGGFKSGPLRKVLLGHLQVHCEARMAQLVEQLESQIRDRAERLARQAQDAENAADGQASLEAQLAVVQRANAMARGLCG